MLPMTKRTNEPFTMGVEEEYLLIDPETRDLTRRPEGFFEACEKALGRQVSREFYRAQIEVGTRIHTSPADVRDELLHLRSTVAEIGKRYGIGIIAASMHPFARQLDQEVTPRKRYQNIVEDLAIAGRRLVVCGMHVHVGVEDQNERIDLMNQVQYFLPHLLTLSTSSPFFEGDDTGMHGYRLTLYQECPRTGLPGRFDSWADYRDAVDVLINAGVIQDATKIWWDVRPSDRFPTLEMRITDVCTRVEDAVAVAALYGCTLRMLARLRRQNQKWRSYPDLLLAENRWRAMRYGVKGSLLDLGRRELVPFRYLIEELLDLVRQDAADLGCEAEIEHARRIVAEGTSADRQLAVHRAALENGADAQTALHAVVDHLAVETLSVPTAKAVKRGIRTRMHATPAKMERNGGAGRSQHS
jgi:glutamate---cysteine ligase / carboxylate-amine ligase